MICSIHQPTYWPWLGLLDKVAKSDLFIILDDVQVSKGSYQYRNIIFGDSGSKFLTLPVKFELGTVFCDLSFKDISWQINHLESIVNSYSLAPFFNEIYPYIEDYYKFIHTNPLDAIISSMRLCMDIFDIRTQVRHSSTIETKKKKGDKVFELCSQVGATTYLAGQGSKVYMEAVLDQFNMASIIVAWHDFKHPLYQQKFGHVFISGLASIDVLFWLGIERSRRLFWDNVGKK